MFCFQHKFSYCLFRSLWSSFVFGVLLVRKQITLTFLSWLLSIWQAFLLFQENVKLELKEQANLYSTLPWLNLWALTKNTRSLISLSIFLNSFINWWWFIIFAYIYTKRFNNYIHDTFLSICFRKLSTNIFNMYHQVE